jgi:hypothetical protein
LGRGRGGWVKVVSPGRRGRHATARKQDGTPAPGVARARARCGRPRAVGFQGAHLLALAAAVGVVRRHVGDCGDVPPGADLLVEVAVAAGAGVDVPGITVGGAGGSEEGVVRARVSGGAGDTARPSVGGLRAARRARMGSGRGARGRGGRGGGLRGAGARAAGGRRRRGGYSRAVVGGAAALPVAPALRMERPGGEVGGGSGVKGCRRAGAGRGV